MTFPVFFDTCALFGGTLADTVLRLADLGPFQILWSRDVLEELERNLADRIDAVAAARRVGAMRAAFPEAEVTGYDELTAGMTCDAKDRHVLAAAVRGRAEVLVTFNTKDFPESAVGRFALTVVHPDEFLRDQLDLHPLQVASALAGQITDARRPALTKTDLLNRLERSGVPGFAAEAGRLELPLGGPVSL